ncbi:hypothetical protein KR50_16930 [Jeotgalibacillus campisalis]|uniref:Uncharacterized protein n=1 Tax=Jeotgalibacillus campisalis TaxID=220754 RepID=A0A0C2VSY0_9BACL|nr:hypothetical protein KR50_16930 [Jeotgalibacillus campisalis]
MALGGRHYAGTALEPTSAFALGVLLQESRSSAPLTSLDDLSFFKQLFSFMS